MNIQRVILGLVACLACGNALADIASVVSNSGGGATLESPVAPLSGAQIVASKSSSAVSIKVSRVVSDVHSLGSAGYATFSTLSAVASAPLSKSGSDSDIANLDGFANAASLELSFNSFRVNGVRNPLPRLKELDAICARVRKAAAGEGVKIADAGCESADVQRFGSSLDAHAFESAFWNLSDKNRWISGASVKAGSQTYTYIDASVVKKAKTDRAPWGVGAFVALNRESWRSTFTLRAQYQDTFADADAGAVCPVVGTGPNVCLTGAVGKPTSSTKELVSLEARRAFKSFGAGLTAVYDRKSKVFGAELPIHFVKDKDGNYTAGLKAGWRNDTHVFTLSVFVGSTFGLFD